MYQDDICKFLVHKGWNASDNALLRYFTASLRNYEWLTHLNKYCWEMNLIFQGKSAELKKVLQASQQQLECQVRKLNL